jgi:hypothetical protein
VLSEERREVWRQRGHLHSLEVARDSH